MRAALAAIGTVAAVAAAPAAAQDEGVRSQLVDNLFGRERFAGLLDLRLGLADGEKSWLDGGFGKARFGGDDGDFEGDAELAEASLIWSPRFAWSLDGHVHAKFDETQDGVRLVEAYARWKPLPRDGWRIQGRAGLFYPPVSLEHPDPGWSTHYTITPSAVNSWIGEEVKVAGLETSASHALGGHELGLDFGVFGYNDTSGTLLAWRGWALHDVKATWDTDFPLPEGALENLDYFLPFQGPVTDPHREVDDRPGFYGRFEWRAPEILTVDLFHYDNAGSRSGFEEGQYAWETRFTDVGVTLDLGPETLVLAQAMTGETKMGRFAPPYRADLGYSAAYLLANRTAGPNSVSARADWFVTNDRTFVADDDNDEEGWALTFAYGREFGRRHRLMFEAMEIGSDRPARAYDSLLATKDERDELLEYNPFALFGAPRPAVSGDPSETQTVLQASWRIEL